MATKVLMNSETITKTVNRITREIVERNQDASKIVVECLQAGLLLTSAGHNNVLRFLPPLTVTEREIDRGLAIFAKVLARQ